jgi:hypothetical protein
MPASRGKDAHRTGLSANGHGREVADHAPRAISQSNLDRAVQLLDGIAERAGDLQNDNLT